MHDLADFSVLAPRLLVLSAVRSRPFTLSRSRSLALPRSLPPHLFSHLCCPTAFSSLALSNMFSPLAFFGKPACSLLPWGVGTTQTDSTRLNKRIDRKNTTRFQHDSSTAPYDCITIANDHLRPPAKRMAHHYPRVHRSRSLARSIVAIERARHTDMSYSRYRSRACYSRIHNDMCEGERTWCDC